MDESTVVPNHVKDSPLAAATSTATHRSRSSSIFSLVLHRWTSRGPANAGRMSAWQVLNRFRTTHPFSLLYRRAIDISAPAPARRATPFFVPFISRALEDILRMCNTRRGYIYTVRQSSTCIYSGTLYIILYTRWRFSKYRYQE